MSARRPRPRSTPSCRSIRSATFAPIGLVTDVPMILVARPNFPAKDLKELVAHVRAQGDKVTYGNVGLGSASHLCGLMFMSAIEAKLTPIYYKGGGPALNDIIAGHIDVYCDPATGPTPLYPGRHHHGLRDHQQEARADLAEPADLGGSRRAGIRRHDLVRTVCAAQHAEADRGCAGRRAAKGAEGPGPDQSFRRTQHGAGRAGPRDACGARSACSRPKSKNGIASSRMPALPRSRAWRLVASVIASTPNKTRDRDKYQSRNNSSGQNTAPCAN